MTEREFDLVARAENFDMELRRDDNGCYWLDFAGCPNMRSLGPFALDEIEDRITAAEKGLNGEQIEGYAADHRWARIHPKTTMIESYPEIGVCCLCGGTYTHFGNNPYPFCIENEDPSRCCDPCNWHKVIPARSRQARQLRKA